jgi:hypothetical protein
MGRAGLTLTTVSRIDPFKSGAIRECAGSGRGAASGPPRSQAARTVRRLSAAPHCISPTITAMVAT